MLSVVIIKAEKKKKGEKKEMKHRTALKRLERTMECRQTLRPNFSTDSTNSFRFQRIHFVHPNVRSIVNIRLRLTTKK